MKLFNKTIVLSAFCILAIISTMTHASSTTNAMLTKDESIASTLSTMVFDDWMFNNMLEDVAGKSLDLIIPESMTQDYFLEDTLEKLTHSKQRKFISSSTAMEPKTKKNTASELTFLVNPFKKMRYITLRDISTHKHKGITYTRVRSLYDLR